jgi:deoxyinosine 3'endonuclease (endonuclease V)
LLVDGNGILHPKKFGLACHLGVLTDTPSLGVAKKLTQIHGLENNEQHRADIASKLNNKGDYLELRSNNQSNDLLGYCYRTEAKNPIYVSLGHKISWTTALWVMGLVTRKIRIPEPIRQADLRTREYLRHLNDTNKKLK